MIKINSIKKIGYGFGYGYQDNKNAHYGKKHFSSLCHAINLGSNFIDTAREYGNGLSEKLIGSLDSKKKNNIFISTKVSPQNLKFNLFIDSVLSSLEALKTKKIDLIQPHWPSDKYDYNEILQAFLYLKSKRLVRYFGLSNFSIKSAEYFKKKIPNYFKFMQDRYIPGDSTSESKINFCKKNNLFFVIYSPFHFFDLRKRHIIKLMKKNNFDHTNYHQLLLKYQLIQYNKVILIPRSYNQENIKNNINSQNIHSSQVDLPNLKKILTFHQTFVPIKDIKIFKGKNYIQNFSDLKNNHKRKFLNLTPVDLAKNIKKNKSKEITSILLKKVGKKFYLKEGQARYWASYICFGKNYKIKSIIL
jgi:diketogulonate reductase-like aldo/keto reductase